MNNGPIKHLSNPIEDGDAVNLRYLKSIPQIKFVEIDLIPFPGKNENTLKKGETYRITENGKIEKKLNERLPPKMYHILSIARKQTSWYYYVYLDFQTDKHGLVLQNSGQLIGRFRICYIVYKESINNTLPKTIVIERSTQELFNT